MLANGLDWDEIGDLVQEAKQRGDADAKLITALKLEKNAFTLKLRYTGFCGVSTGMLLADCVIKVSIVLSGVLVRLHPPTVMTVMTVMTVIAKIANSRVRHHWSS